MTQFSIALKREYSLNVPFRRLLEDLSSFGTLYTHIDGNLPDKARERFGVDNSSDERTADKAAAASASVGKSIEIAASSGKSRGASITTSRGDKLSAGQQAAIQDIVRTYVGMTSGSKERTQSNRTVLADPRSVAGFNPIWKEAVYPIITDRSSGAYLWDIDGNQFVDFTCGFGPILLGHGPEFLQDAVIEQVKVGVETGPQTPLAFDVAKLISDATGVERVAFASTGTEAVIAATRIAGRSTP